MFRSVFSMAVCLALGGMCAARDSPEQAGRIDCGGHRCELVWEPNAVKLRVEGADRLRGLLLLKPETGGTTTRLNLLPCGDGCLSANLDMTRVPAGTVGVKLYLSSRGGGTSQTEARLPLRLDPEAVAIARQVICPVTGQPLGAMGKPAKGIVAGRTVYVCCEPCLDLMREEPKKYLAKIGIGRRPVESHSESLQQRTGGRSCARALAQ